MQVLDFIGFCIILGARILLNKIEVILRSTQTHQLNTARVEETVIYNTFSYGMK